MAPVIVSLQFGLTVHRCRVMHARLWLPGTNVTGSYKLWTASNGNTEGNSISSQCSMMQYSAGNQCTVNNSYMCKC